MRLTRLDIDGVRNLQPVRLTDLGRVNILYGANGSGKTSALEAIYLLGMARSFRATRFHSVINNDQQQLTVYGEVELPGGSRHRLGVTRSRGGESEARVDGQRIANRSALAAAFPLQIIHSDSFELLRGSPGVRRQFMDWGVFHVEPVFLEAWQRFQRAIKQRNTVLRHGKISGGELAPWEKELGEVGALVHQARERQVERLKPVFQAILQRMAPALEPVTLRYRPGWNVEQPLGEVLEQNRSSDAQQGFTQAGPQRADIRISCEGGAAADVLSRGQQKLVVCALKLAQGQTLMDARQLVSTYLVDDLSAELDKEHYGLVAAELESMQSQVFVTCIGESEAAVAWPVRPLGVEGATAAAEADNDRRVFHVEHGRLIATQA